VFVDGNSHEGPFYIRNPFSQAPDWAEASRNLYLDKLLARVDPSPARNDAISPSP
jgi:hypothetical protein